MNGPTVHLPGDARTWSALLGLPVRQADDPTGPHAPACAWCDGHDTDETCRRSVWLREYAAGLGEPC